jgi:2-aminoethylphosphonate-pyruvate transaminase
MKKLLFTPGPLMTSSRVKLATNVDLGSRDAIFTGIINNVRTKLLDIYKHNNDQFCSVLVPGSGTYGVESCFNTFGRNKKILILSNGRYGERMKKICDGYDFNSTINVVDDATSLNVDNMKYLLDQDNYDMVSMIHSETTTGNINDVDGICKFIKTNNPETLVMVDAMSSFGAIPINNIDSIDLLIASSNKCLHGLPGCAFVIARKTLMEHGDAISHSLDLCDQYNAFEKTQQFRFTPPVQIMVGFNEALNEFQEEGGQPSRYDKYNKRAERLRNGMRELGYAQLEIDSPGPIIQTFLYPSEDFDFNNFYNQLSDRNITIYPGKMGDIDTFRISTIGDMTDENIDFLLKNIGGIQN